MANCLYHSQKFSSCDTIVLFSRRQGLAEVTYHTFSSFLDLREDCPYSYSTGISV